MLQLTALCSLSVGYTAVNILPALAELAQLTSLMLKANGFLIPITPAYELETESNSSILH